MNKFRVYKGASGAIMSEKWEILEQWGAPATPAEILEWAHENALRANAAYDCTKKQYHAALAFAKAQLGEKAEICRCFAWGGVSVGTLSECAGVERTFGTFDIAGVTNPKRGQLNTYSVKVDGFGECQLVSWLS
jgi:hypothetical protein